MTSIFVVYSENAWKMWTLYIVVITIVIIILAIMYNVNREKNKCVVCVENVNKKRTIETFPFCSLNTPMSLSFNPGKQEPVLYTEVTGPINTFDAYNDNLNIDVSTSLAPKAPKAFFMIDFTVETPSEISILPKFEYQNASDIYMFYPVIDETLGFIRSGRILWDLQAFSPAFDPINLSIIITRTQAGVLNTDNKVVIEKYRIGFCGNDGEVTPSIYNGTLNILQAELEANSPFLDTQNSYITFGKDMIYPYSRISFSILSGGPLTKANLQLEFSNGISFTALNAAYWTLYDGNLSTETGTVDIGIDLNYLLGYNESGSLWLPNTNEYQIKLVRTTVPGNSGITIINDSVKLTVNCFVNTYQRMILSSLCKFNNGILYGGGMQLPTNFTPSLSILYDNVYITQYNTLEGGKNNSTNYIDIATAAGLSPYSQSNLEALAQVDTDIFIACIRNDGTQGERTIFLIQITDDASNLYVPLVYKQQDTVSMLTSYVIDIKITKDYIVIISQAGIPTTFNIGYFEKDTLEPFHVLTSQKFSTYDSKSFNIAVDYEYNITYVCGTALDATNHIAVNAYINTESTIELYSGFLNNKVVEGDFLTAKILRQGSGNFIIAAIKSSDSVLYIFSLKEQGNINTEFGPNSDGSTTVIFHQISGNLSTVDLNLGENDSFTISSLYYGNNLATTEYSFCIASLNYNGTFQNNIYADFPDTGNNINTEAGQPEYSTRSAFINNSLIVGTTLKTKTLTSIYANSLQPQINIFNCLN